MVGNFLKIIAVLIIGYFLGWIIGGGTGAILVAIPGLLISEPVNSYQMVWMSLTLTFLVGGVIGFLANQIANKIFSVNDKAFIGILIGIMISIVVIFFRDILIIVGSEDVIEQSFLMVIIVSGIAFGSDVGSFVFPTIGVIRIIKDIIEDSKQTEDSKERLDNLKKFLK